MPKIIFDTSIGTTNLGDHIIMDAVNRIADELFLNDFVINIPTHFSIHPKDLLKLRKYDTGIVGGTNLLKNDTLRKSQWKVGMKDVLVLRHKVVLLGVGWWQYQEKPVSLYSRAMYKALFSAKYLHAVRDSYTLQKLNEMGIKNVVNTGCPTVWGLDEPHCSQINPKKRDKVVTTITDYMRDPERDRRMLELLKKHYHDVYVWIQGSKDQSYIESLASNVHYIAPKLSAFDAFLENEPCEYIGTRLHAGIRALQKKRKAIIIGIDNRAIEMRNDIGLNVLERQRIDQLEEKIHEEMSVQLYLDTNAIQRWKAQFNP
ncbi:polysaccharide pyruvyl transferase family protein [Parapedobacter koreensis]|uniref:Polysaccharide pyruvyl transferase family protein WcaK n=1 Tax=Parapedobacter koreensis TaxID=332977 RepID=A0A1H7QDZ7_9SPHI|nr:polysaccharide pyruvyl transferase family protein [Parapedobacter koreensis]SEL46341.1 Polysaccharide pyruvyl transferase family protein WcaK [Parapedobacter koreensis]